MGGGCLSTSSSTPGLASLAAGPGILPDVLDADGNRIKWRYASNEKGSLNEEGCEDYLRNILGPAIAGVGCK
jgi:hypothetical protein